MSLLCGEIEAGTEGKSFESAGDDDLGLLGFGGKVAFGRAGATGVEDSGIRFFAGVNGGEVDAVDIEGGRSRGFAIDEDGEAGGGFGVEPEDGLIGIGRGGRGDGVGRFVSWERAFVTKGGLQEAQKGDDNEAVDYPVSGKKVGMMMPVGFWAGPWD